MGSILSFPVLCIANAALTRLCLEADSSYRGGRFRKQSLTLRQAQFLVNGDDIVTKLSPFGRWLWGVVGRETMGLIESVGKTYFTRDFIEMNSRLFRYHDPTDILSGREPQQLVAGRRPPRFSETPLLNLGLVFGLVRSSAGGARESAVVGNERVQSLGSRMQELRREMSAGGGFGDGAWGRVKWKCLALNSGVLDRTPIPWHLGEHIGGLGIPGTPTEKDLRLVRAAKLADLRFTRESNALWLVWKRVHSRLMADLGSAVRALGPVERIAQDRAIALLTVDSLFDSRLTLDDLVMDPRDACRAILRENERLWRKLNAGRYGYPSLDFYASRLGWSHVGEELGVGERAFAVTEADRDELNLVLDQAAEAQGFPFTTSLLVY